MLVSRACGDRTIGLLIVPKPAYGRCQFGVRLMVDHRNAEEFRKAQQTSFANAAPLCARGLGSGIVISGDNKGTITVAMVVG